MVNLKRLRIKFFFRILFAIISIIGLIGYFRFKPILQQSLIVYQIANKIEHTGGRGVYYTLSVIYQGKSYKLDITSKMYNSIDEGIFPNLYYSETYDTVISNWTVDVWLRISILFSILAFLTFIPWHQRTR